MTCLMEPEPVMNELPVTSLHHRVDRARAVAAAGWAVRFAADLAETAPPTNLELDTLRDLHRRTDEAHRGGAK